MTTTQARWSPWMAAGLLALCLTGCGSDEAPEAAVPVPDTSGDVALGDAGLSDGGSPPAPDPGPEPPDPGALQPDPGPQDALDSWKDTNVIPDPRADARVVALSVTQGVAGGGTETVLLCVGFDLDFREAIPAVSFGIGAATGTEALSKGVLRTFTPSGEPGPVDVSVQVGGQAGTLKAGFEYLAALPASYVEVALGAAIEPAGVILQLPLTVTSHGGAKPAALLIDLKTDALLLPLSVPTQVEGKTASASGKDLHTKAKNDGMRLLVLGKNRTTLESGVLSQLYYNVPPTDPYELTPITVTAKAVNAYGVELPVLTKSGYLVVDEGD